LIPDRTGETSRSNERTLPHPIPQARIVESDFVPLRLKSTWLEIFKPKIQLNFSHLLHDYIVSGSDLIHIKASNNSSKGCQSLGFTQQKSRQSTLRNQTARSTSCSTFHLAWSGIIFRSVD
jgi:hypothetical protein